MHVRSLIIAGHAFAGLAIAAAIWTGCALAAAAAADSGLAGPTIAAVRPFASRSPEGRPMTGAALPRR